MTIGIVGILAQLPCELHAVLAGEAQIEHDHIDRLLSYGLHHLRTCRNPGNAKVVLDEIVGDQLVHRRIVVNGEDIGFCGLRYTSQLSASGLGDTAGLEAMFGDAHHNTVVKALPVLVTSVDQLDR